MFNPQLQNITKENNDQSTVGLSTVSQIVNQQQVYLKVTAPIACIHSVPEIDFTIPNYYPGEYGNVAGTIFFAYDIQAANAVESNNYGAELIETTQLTGEVTINLNSEHILGSWDKFQEVKQVIGVPFLSDIPILKYLFSTTTTSKEKSKVYLSVKAEILNSAITSEEVGKLQKLK